MLVLCHMEAFIHYQVCKLDYILDGSCVNQHILGSCVLQLDPKFVFFLFFFFTPFSQATLGAFTNNVNLPDLPQTPARVPLRIRNSLQHLPSARVSPAEGLSGAEEIKGSSFGDRGDLLRNMALNVDWTYYEAQKLCKGSQVNQGNLPRPVRHLVVITGSFRLLAKLRRRRHASERLWLC